jgi:hypothetical protein
MRAIGGKVEADRSVRVVIYLSLLGCAIPFGGGSVASDCFVLVRPFTQRSKAIFASVQRRCPGSW